MTFEPGASPDTAMAHLVITNVKDGKNVAWLEEVNDKEYAEGAVKAVDPIRR